MSSINTYPLPTITLASNAEPTDLKVDYWFNPKFFDKYLCDTIEESIRSIDKALSLTPTRYGKFKKKITKE